MLIYIGVFSLSTLSVYFAQKGDFKPLISLNRGKVKIKTMAFLCWAIAFIFPFIVSAIRYDVGTDQLSYAFIKIPQILDGRYFIEAVGFEYFVKLFAFITTDGLLICSSIIFVELFLFYKCFYDNSEIPWISIMLFFLLGIYNMSFNIFRQMLSVAIFFYAIKHIKKKKFISYLICVLIAASFHMTAFIYIPIYFFQYINLRKNFKGLIFLLLAFIFQDNVIKILENVSTNFGKYAAYFGGNYYGSSFSWSLFFITMSPLIVFHCLDRKAKDKKELLTSNLYFNISAAACFFSALYKIIPNADRFVYLLLPVQCLYVPHIMINSLKTGRQKKQFGIFIMLVALIFFCYYFVYLNCGETLPYQTIFNYKNNIK